MKSFQERVDELYVKQYEDIRQALGYAQLEVSKINISKVATHMIVMMDKHVTQITARDAVTHMNVNDLFDSPATTCDHVWVDYVGMTDSYRFCKKCDEKEIL